VKKEIVMRAITSIVLTSLLIAGAAAAAPFDPKPGEICTPDPIASAGRSKVEPRKLLGVLLKSHKIFDADLDQGGKDITFDVKMNAVLHSNTFCDSPGRCTEGTAEKLVGASTALTIFLNRNSRPAVAGQASFEVTPPVGNDIDAVRVSAFLRGARGAFQVACIASAAPPAPPSEAALRATKFVSSIAVRKNSDDLAISSSADKFKSLERASISYTDDRIKSTRTLATEGAAGYQLPESLTGQFARGILFTDYTGNLAWPNDPKDNKNVGNIGAGVLGAADIPVGGYFQNVALFGRYVHSHVTDSDLVSGKLVVTPDLPIPGVGIAFNPNDGPLAFLLKPQLSVVYGSVLNAGSNLDLFNTSDYARGGGKIAFWVFGVDGIFKNLTWSTSYESAKVWRGPLASVSLLESTLSYTLGDQDNWALQLKYANGRNADTLERQQIVTIGLGYKQ
jgi:hypothetical protein